MKYNQEITFAENSFTYAHGDLSPTKIGLWGPTWLGTPTKISRIEVFIRHINRTRVADNRLRIIHLHRLEVICLPSYHGSMLCRRHQPDAGYFLYCIAVQYTMLEN
jgi:hypothetical protein